LGGALIIDDFVVSVSTGNRGWSALCAYVRVQIHPLVVYTRVRVCIYSRMNEIIQSPPVNMDGDCDRGGGCIVTHYIGNKSSLSPLNVIYYDNCRRRLLIV
jgi:hypothetical protein